MKKEHLEFLGELIKKIAIAYKTYRNNDCNIEIEHHTGKDYWTINCQFRYCNSKYEDCVVFYLTEDDFDPTEILKDFDTILGKAKLLLGQ